MSKKYSIFITVLFCLFTFGFGAALIILPDRDFSEQENRYLTQFKAPTLDSVFGENGQFMVDIFIPLPAENAKNDTESATK